MATIKGTSASEILQGGSANDVIYGYGGNDSLYGGLGVNDLYGGTGQDLFGVTARSTAGASDDLVMDFQFGADRADLSAWGVSDFGQIQALLVNDGRGDAALNAQFGGRDHLFTFNNIAKEQLVSGDFLYNGGGARDMTGTNSADVLFGSKAGDRINGGGGDDTLLGGGGNDVLVGGSGLDRYDGGAGYDEVSFAFTSESVKVNLASGTAALGNGGTERLTSIEDVTGSAGNDTIAGNSADNALDGGAGRDTLTGGAGDDHFVFANTAHSGLGTNADRITDFKLGEDVVDLREIDAWTKSGTTNNAFAWIGKGGFTGAGGELRHLHSGDTTVVQGDTNGDRKADFEIRLDSKLALISDDFLL